MEATKGESVYSTASGDAKVYKLSTTPENKMQAGHTDSNTNKLCPRQLQTKYTQISLIQCILNLIIFFLL